jgi:hypothetical protein
MRIRAALPPAYHEHGSLRVFVVLFGIGLIAGLGSA